MIVPILLIAISALALSGTLFRHTRILTFVAVAAALWELSWLFLTLLARTVLIGSDQGIVYITGSIVIVFLTGIYARKYPPSLPWGRKLHDIVGEATAIGLTLLVLLGAFLIFRVNGFTNNAWITHGFFNGDTATLMALTRKSFDTPGLVSENPFAANGALEYPSLLHAGIASLLSNANGSWVYLLPILSYATIFFTIPLFFLLWETAQEGERKTHWFLPVALIAIILTASWDSYIYPQSHFFLTGLFLLQAALLYQASRQRNVNRHILEAIAAIAAVVLLFSNAITGTAAIAVATIYALQAGLSHRSRMTNWYTLAAAVAVGFFFLFSPGNSALTSFGFSYTAAPDMLRLTPLLALLIFGAYLERERSFLVSSASVVAALAFIPFIFSGRDIVVANASRFFYHSLLIHLYLEHAFSLFYLLSR